MLTERKQCDYQRLQGLENRATHTPVKNEDLADISKRLYGYTRAKILVIHVVLPLFLFVGSIFLSYLLTPHVQTLQSPFKELVVELPPILAGGFSVYEAFKVVSDKLSVARRKARRLRGEGIWEDLKQIS